jgi:molybdopterin-guanine dinucleotide biosynthesis adapter protein
MVEHFARISGHRVIGVAGFKNSGKTTLVEKLVQRLTAMGYRVSTVKHAHHSFDLDQEGRDSFRHRAAGASEVAVVSRQRFAIMHELRDEAAPSLEEILAKLAPCDVVIVEGYKRDSHPKIEVRNLDLDHPALAGDDPTVIVIAATRPIDSASVPVFSRDDVQALTDFIVSHCPLIRSEHDTSFMLRRAGTADADAIRSLSRIVYAKWVPIIGREPLPMSADYDKAVLDHWIDVHEVDGQLVGFIEMIPRSDHLFIQNLAIATQHQGKGLANRFMARAFQLAKAAQLPEIRLLTNLAFTSNVQMYEHFGFERYAETPFPLGGTTVYFRKAVS